ncbi:MAG: DUF1573 domain-containing protein [Chitinophagaceae bacterium]|nr:DUF1573 domain-containing protein [Chitinophagaceae bacterium]MCW5906217.1 DUF1573 domain-containing protein [Chitinophagaceae bacterium]
MKKLLLVALLFSCLGVFAQSSAEFKTVKHDFGKIKHNVPATYIFKFVNKGEKPLIIESAVAGCGCTTPEYPKQPIAKGKEGTIKVTYNAASMGVFTKDVTVKFANEKQPTVLNIIGEVIEAKAPTKPVKKG